MGPTTKHQAADAIILDATTDEGDREVPLAPFTFRTDPELRAAAEQVCARHGLTLPAFLRAAQALLVRAYGG